MKITRGLNQIWLLCAVSLLLPERVEAQFTYTNADGSIYYYSTNADGVSVTITGGSGGALTIPTNINNLMVTAIASGAFVNRYDVTSVTIPETITSIGEAAFAASGLTNLIIFGDVTNMGAGAFFCPALTRVAILSSGGLIGDDAFRGCINLTNVTLPNGLTSIGNLAFEDCQNLTKFTIPASVTNIGTNAFFQCFSLANITIPENVVSIGPAAFYDCSSLTNITIGSGIAEISYQAFSGCSSLPNITIPASVESIDNVAFESCTRLTNVTISIGVTTIMSYAFDGCSSLPSVTIPASVTNIGDGAFPACSSLMAIIVDSENEYYTSINGVLFDKNETRLIQYPGGMVGSYTIPAGVNTVGEAAFEGSTGLTDVVIPESVTNMGMEVFCQCGKLVNVIIPSSLTNIPDYAFDYCGRLTSVFMEGNAPSVGQYMFYDNDPTVYYLPGTSGWSTNFAGSPSVLWNPLIEGAGVQNNQFGFNITGTINIPIVVETCINLTNPVWTPLTNVTLTNGSVYFSDPEWTNYRVRYYGIGFP